MSLWRPAPTSRTRLFSLVTRLRTFPSLLRTSNRSAGSGIRISERYIYTSAPRPTSEISANQRVVLGRSVRLRAGKHRRGINWGAYKSKLKSNPRSLGTGKPKHFFLCSKTVFFPFAGSRLDNGKYKKPQPVLRFVCTDLNSVIS